MKKTSTVAAKQTKNFREQKLTIGNCISNCVTGHEKGRMTHGYRQNADRSTAEGL